VDLQKTIAEYRLWREKALQVTLRPGNLPNPDIFSSDFERAVEFTLSLGLGAWLMITLVNFYQSPTATHWFWWTVVGFLSLYWLRPWAYLAAPLWGGATPTRLGLKAYSWPQRLLSAVVASRLIVWGLQTWLPEPCTRRQVLLGLCKSKWYLTEQQWLYAWWGLCPLLALVVYLCLPSHPKPLKRAANSPSGDDETSSLPKPQGLYLGRSQGRLARLFHRQSLAPYQRVALSVADCCQNIMVLGSIGSGKTTRVMQPVLVQCLDQGVGGLVFDIKGDVKPALEALGPIAQRPVIYVGPHHGRMNLLQDLTPETAAMMLKSVFLMDSQHERFWTDTAAELCRHTLGLLWFLPEHYNLQTLYSYLFDDEVQSMIQAQLNPLLINLPPEDSRLLASYLRYHTHVFATFDDKVKSGVMATLARTLSPFNHPTVMDAFCEIEAPALDFTTLLDGQLMLIDMPLATWGVSAKVAYTFIKLRFFHLMQNRHTQPLDLQRRPVLFMCDEYQELVTCNPDGLSDVNFWDKSRASLTWGVVATQSVASLTARLGRRDVAHTILQNFRQKICFRTEDTQTLQWLSDLLGTAEVKRRVKSQTHSATSGRDKTYTQSIHYSREPVLPPSIIRELGPDEAVAILSIQSQSCDDVLTFQPLYLEA